MPYLVTHPTHSARRSDAVGSGLEYRGARRLLAMLPAVLSLLSGCMCESSDVLAKLVESQGTIVRDFSASVGKWQSAEIGAEFRVGDAVRSKKSSDAVLELSGDSFVRLTPESVIRFLEVAGDDKKNVTHGIDVETGEAEMVVGKSEVVLVTSVGRAKLQSGTRIQLRKSEKGVEYRVQIGQATFYDKTNNSSVVKAGEGILVAIGAAILERFEASPDTGEAPAEAPPPADTEKETAADEPAPDTEAPTEDNRSRGSSSGRREADSVGGGPDWADLSVTAGDSFILHVARPPTSVEMRLEGKCPGNAVVQIDRKLVSKGSDSVNVLLKRGRHAYKVYCADDQDRLAKEPAARGTILVLRDAGAARLPKSAASSFVETDGRQYKILYQTRIPNISVRWNKGPKGQKYVLHVSSKKGKKTINTAKAEHTFKSGELGEGTHRIKYEAIGNLSRTSKTTTVSIRFDNAAPKASISEPKEGGFAPGSQVSVAGVAVEGWSVSVVGGEIEMDEQHRFKGSASHAKGYRSVVFRLTHKRRGVHYYLRRASGNTQ